MPTVIEFNKELEEHKAARKGYKPSKEEQEAIDFFDMRKGELQKARQNVVGTDIESIWRAADKAYIPHTLKSSKGKSTLVSDDELGWRSSPIQLGKSDDWMEDSVPTNPYVKIQTALSIIVDRNPEAVFKPASEKYEGSTELMQELYNTNWDRAQSREQLKVMVMNAAKYGVFMGMTKPLKIQREVRTITNFDPKNPKKNEYETEMSTVYDDVYRWALDPWTVWLDDMARVGDIFSLNDWMYYKDFSWESFKEQFKGFQNFQFAMPKARPKGVDDEEQRGKQLPENTKKDIVRVWFYENLARDHFFVMTDDQVVLINEPIPREPKNKRLSIFVAPWTLRHQSTLYGIGVYEAMRNNYKLYLKIRNMTVDQTVQSIYKEFFYEGTNMLQNTGEMRTAPGKGRQVTNPKSIVWNEVPAAGAEAWGALDFIKKEIDDDTGITKTLEGELSPEAKAFDIAQARESALRRLKTPLDNIAHALEQDAYITTGLMEEIYSVPEILKITDEKEIQEYRVEIAQGNVDAQNVTETTQVNEETGLPQTLLEVKQFRSFPLNLDRDTEGNITQVKDEQFFEVQPDDLRWEGKISITGQSIIPESPLLEKQNKLEMSNILLPLFAQPPEIVLPAAKQLLKIYDEEPEDWFPLTWLQLMNQEQNPQEQQLFVPQQPQLPGQPGPVQGGGATGAQEAAKIAPATQVQGGNNQSQVGRFVGKLNPFKT